MGVNETPSTGDLRVWYVPQVPMKAFYVNVPDVETGKRVLAAIIEFSLFEFENNVKPDYSDAGGIVRWEDDGEDGHDWFDVEYEDE
jgi:hypothetical protein